MPRNGPEVGRVSSLPLLTFGICLYQEAAVLQGWVYVDDGSDGGGAKAGTQLFPAVLPDARRAPVPGPRAAPRRAAMPEVFRQLHIRQ